MDKYKNFAELHAAEREGEDFRVDATIRPNTKTVILAPHGGGIEPGTSELAVAIAGTDLHIALFEGLKDKNADLHITSTRFDVPRCVQIVEQSHAVLALHGEHSAEAIVYVGGADFALPSRKLWHKPASESRSTRMRTCKARRPRTFATVARAAKGCNWSWRAGCENSSFNRFLGRGENHRRISFTAS